MKMKALSIDEVKGDEIMKGAVRKKDIFGRSPGLQGMHTWDDAFVLAKKDFGEDLAISGLSDIIMNRF
jgi:hypothetical protein